MDKKLSLVDLVAAIQRVVTAGTGRPCYDAVPKDAPAPFYYAEVGSARPQNTKTLYVDCITVYIHAIGETGGGHVQIYELIRELEQALTVDIVLPDPFQLIRQDSAGMQNLKRDETGEPHAVLAFKFLVCYGLKIKI